MVANCIDITQRCARLWLAILRSFLGALGRCTLGVRRGAFLGCTLLCIPIALLSRFHSVQRYAQLLCDFGASHPFLIKGERLISRFHLHRHHYPSSFSVPVSARAVVLFQRKSAGPLQSQRRAPLTPPLRERFWRSSNFPVPRPGMCPRTGQRLSTRTARRPSQTVPHR